MKNTLKVIGLIAVLAGLSAVSAKAQYPIQMTGYTNVSFTVLSGTNAATGYLTDFYSGVAGRSVQSLVISNAGTVDFDYKWGNVTTTTNVSYLNNYETLKAGAILTFPSTGQNFIPPPRFNAKSTTNDVKTSVVNFKAFIK